MAPKRIRRRARYYTPPIELSTSISGHIQTPQRCGVLYAKLFAQRLGIQIPNKIVEEVTGVADRTQRRILGSKQPRSLTNIPDNLEPRGRNRAITKQESSAVATYLDDDSVDIDDKGKPWIEILRDSGVDIPQTIHFNPSGYHDISERGIRNTLFRDEKIINAVCEEERDLSKKQAETRIIWRDKVLEDRPKDDDWKDVAFCDEFHIGLGPQVTKRIKRKQGPKYRYKPANVHRKKITTKDIRAKAREENHLRLLNVFLVVGLGWRYMTTYEVNNSVGKMTIACYTEQILPKLLPELRKRNLTLCQDADSAHRSPKILRLFKEAGVDLLTLPGSSPDFSVFESLARGLKRQFHSKSIITQKQGLARFEEIFKKEMKEDIICNMYNNYTQRLRDCKDRNGQMTKY